MQPGETVTPGSEQPQPPATNQTPQDPPTTPEPQAVLTQEPVSDWQYRADTDPSSQSPEQITPVVNPVTWTASEFISHRKGTAWFAALGLGLFLLIVVVYLLTKDIFASIGLAVAGLAFGAFSVRPPRTLDYAIDEKGVHIGQRFFTYNEFKSFSIIEDGPFPSIMLMPLKRFLPPITLFCDPQSADAIIGALSAYLPHETREPDAVDKLMGHLRF